jgi:hypothetical protein
LSIPSLAPKVFMEYRCKICRREDREEIDKRLLAGEPNRQIAMAIGVNEIAIRRHKPHLPLALIQARQAEEVSSADRLLAEYEEIRSHLRAAYKAATAEGNHRAAIMAEAQRIKLLELGLRVEGILQDRRLSIKATLDLNDTLDEQTMRRLARGYLSQYDGSEN